jgi:predicted aspartyl protease
LKNLDLVLDTGASVSVVDQRLAKKLRLEPVSQTLAVSLDQTGQFQQVVLSELEFGSVSLRGLQVLVGDLSFFGPGSSIDAIVGFDVLSKRNFSVDYAAKIVTFDTVNSYDSSVPFEAGFPVVVVRIQVGEVTLRMLVDTGGRDLVLFENRLQGRLKGRMKGETQDNLDHAGGQSAVKKALVCQVQVGPTRLGNATAYLLEVPDHAYPGLHGVLGPFSLGVKRIQFDFKEGILAWER